MELSHTRQWTGLKSGVKKLSKSQHTVTYFVSKNNFKYCLEGTPESITTMRRDGCDENRDEPRLAAPGRGAGAGLGAGRRGQAAHVRFPLRVSGSLKGGRKRFGNS